jgi:hypothetical protein
MTESPFFNYRSCFDAEAIMRRHAAPDLQPSPDHLTNFLGVRISPRFFPLILKGREGQIEEIPIPANWHADIAEWASVLRAVELSRDTFTVLELGCGWGCWLNNAGVAARRAGRKVFLIGVEGEPNYIKFAHEAAEDNGFGPDQLTLLRGVAAPDEGIALFPKQRVGGKSWGLAPTFNPNSLQRFIAKIGLGYDVLPKVTLSHAIGDRFNIDLLHVDIQGGEADFVEASIDEISSKVSYMVIGTHSHPIENALKEILSSFGWIIEVERAAIYSGVVLTVDGVLGCRNGRLLPTP